MIFRI